MSDKINLKPVEEEKSVEQIPEPEKKEQLINLNKREGEYILNEIYNLLTIYYSANQLSNTPLPKEPNWYLNEILLTMKEFHIIETE